MSTTAEIPVEHGVAHVALTTGPASRLTEAVLRQIDAALSAIEDDDAIEAVVLSGRGASFPSGLAEPEAGGDDKANHLAAICNRIEAFPKPVIAVITGTVVGGGAELALACHHRLVHAGARIGFPHVRMGLVPRAGATQRLPRIAGAETAIGCLLGGQLAPFAGQPTHPLADQVFDGGRYEAITAYLDQLRAAGFAPRPTAQIRDGFADGIAYQAAVTAARQGLDPEHDIAATKILSAIEAALVLPMEAGLRFEEAAAEDCAESPQARALTHLFHAEQAVSTHTRRSDLTEIATIAVLGPGALAAQIVIAALDAGLRVIWIIRDPDHLREATAHVQRHLQEAVMKGRIDADQARLRLDALTAGNDPDALRDADIILRAARGQRGVTVPPNVPVAHCLTGSDSRLSMRFAPLTAATRLVEVILGPEGTESDLRAALGLAKRLHSLAVIERTASASIHDRLTGALWRAADALVDLGQSPFTVDAALRAWGMALPPFALADHVGLDTVARQDRGPGAQNWAALIAGQHGGSRAAGSGFYTSSASGPPVPDAEAQALIDQTRAPKADMPAAVIRQLLIGAMANEGARLLHDGVVQEASEIDLVSVLSGVLPRWSGGVMHAACDEGLLRITKAMTSLPHPDTAFWTPEPVFAELIKYGRSFDDR